MAGYWLRACGGPLDIGASYIGVHGACRQTHMMLTVDRHLRSAVSMTLVVPATRCSTLGDRAFPVSAARTWNALPSGVRAAPSLTTFRQKLKQTLFLQSFPDEWLATMCLYSVPVTVCNCDSVTLISSLVNNNNNNNNNNNILQERRSNNSQQIITREMAQAHSQPQLGGKRIWGTKNKMAAAYVTMHIVKW